MKTNYSTRTYILISVILVLIFNGTINAQNEVEEQKVEKPVRPPYETGVLIETQTHLVWPVKTLEFVIQHRFGKLNSETFDLGGLYAPSNIRMGLNYGLYKNLQIGIGTTKSYKAQDLNIKYKILTQTRSNSMPVGLAYYGNMEYYAREEQNFGSEYQLADRVSYFNQLILGRRFSRKLTVQLTGNYAHFNQIDTTIVSNYVHDNFGIGVAGRFKFASQMSVLFEYDQSLTTPEHIKPNLSLGIEISTSAHAFHVFVTTYNYISYQRNLMYNINDFSSGDLLIGFNITRNWGF